MKLEIEDTSDCDTCEKRHIDDWALMQQERIKCLGEAWCQECGRQYTAISVEAMVP